MTYCVPTAVQQPRHFYSVQRVLLMTYAALNGLKENPSANMPQYIDDE